MKTIQLQTINSSSKRQQGIATVLFVVLVSLGLIATGFTLMHTTRSTQEKHVAVNSVTHAQTGAWVGAEAFRRYLEALDEDTLPGLHGSMQINLGGGEYGSIQASNVVVEDLGSGSYRINADIVNRHDASRSSAILGVTYETSLGTCSGCSETLMSLDFHDDLQITGGIEVLTPTGTLPNLNIDGNVDINNLTISDLGDINATGNATLGSGVVAENLHSNGNVTLSSHASVDKVVALGWLKAYDSSNAEVSWVNGTALIASSGRFEHVNARDDITITAGSHGDFKADGDVTVGNSINTIDSIQATGDVDINTWDRVSEVIGMGNLDCINSSWTKFTSLSVNGSVSGSCPVTATGGASNSVVPMAEQTPYSMPELVIDVWPLKGDANYVFEYDTAESQIKVTVNNITGIVSGTQYYVGRYTNTQRGYLCSSINAMGVCDDGSSPEFAICLGFSLENDCLSYNTTTKTWDFSGTSIAPGIMWFEGNVTVNTGVHYSSILASGNINGAGNYNGYAANYGGYDEVCLATGEHVDDSMRAYHTARFATHYPSNLCDKDAADYLPIPTGNIGLAAGGYDPDGDGSYSGGDIKTAALANIYGSVLAGNLLRTLGETNIYGYVTAANLGETGTNKNLLGASTSIDLTHVTEDYNPAQVPSMGVHDNVGGGGTPAPPTAKLLWARYL